MRGIASRKRASNHSQRLRLTLKNPTLIKAECTTSTDGAPFDSSNSNLLVFPFFDSTDIEEIYFTFGDEAAGQIAEIEFSNPGKPDAH